MELFPQLGVDRALPEPLSDQLTARVRDAILTRGIVPGEPLPPTRELAAAIGVSRAVAVAAYERLVGEGFLESRQGAGTRVVPQLPVWQGVDAGSESAAAVPPPNTQPIPAALPWPPGAPPIDLRPGRPYVAPTPPRSWVQALASAARHQWASDASDPIGHIDLRTALADHTRRSRGIGCRAEHVTVTTGTSDALLTLGLALRALHGRPPRIVVEDPGYQDGIRVLDRVGATLLPLPVGMDGATAAALWELSARSAPANIDAVLLTPSHQFPLGGRIPASERLAILEWARENGALVIEDDYDSEFRHAGSLLPAMASLGGEVATITSLNKMLSPSIRCGAIVLAGHGEAVEQLRTEIRGVREDLGPALPLMMQVALASLLESGGFRREIARTRREYRHRRELLLDTCAAAGVQVQGADGGLHIVVPMSAACAIEAVAELARRAVLVDRVNEYRVEGSAVGTVDNAIAPRNGGAAAELSAASARYPTFDGLIVGYGAEPATRLRLGILEIFAVLGDLQPR